MTISWIFVFTVIVGVESICAQLLKMGTDTTIKLNCISYKLYTYNVMCILRPMRHCVMDH